MRAYIIRRLLLMILSLFLLTILVFLSVRLLPGDVIDAILGRMMEISTVGTIDREGLERQLGLDVPGYVQYARWLGGMLLRGSLGESLMGRGPVGQQIVSRLPVTLELGLLAIVIGLVIALPVGIYSAIRQDTAADYAGALGRYHRPGNTQLLARNHGHGLPGNLVGLVAIDGVDSFL